MQTILFMFHFAAMTTLAHLLEPQAAYLYALAGLLVNTDRSPTT